MIEPIFFSIIIPTCNRKDLLGICIDQLIEGRQTFTDHKYEIIVTDDSKDDATSIFCKNNYPGVLYVKGPRKGPAANRNHGASHAVGEWLVFLDDDCIPQADILINYQKSILAKGNKIFVFEGAIKPVGRKRAYNEEAPINEEGGLLWSCNFCIQRLFFHSIEGFTESYPYPAMEDIDIQLKIFQSSSVIYFAANAIVYHPWSTITNPSKKFKERFESHKIFLSRWPDESWRFTPIILFKKIVYTWLRIMPANFFNFKGRGLFYLVAYSTHLIKLMIYQLKRGFFV